jgi:hypothetical protein
MPTPQSASNHTAFDVVTHFILGPIFLLTIAVAIIAAFHAHGPLMIALHLWLVVVAVAFLLLNVKTRLYSLALQDRLIRLEERQRLAALLPAAEAAVAIQSLSMRQLIALRFASDAELPALVRATLAEGLEPKQIKARIQTWRPDLVRI